MYRNRAIEVLLSAVFALVPAGAARADYLRASSAYAQKDFAAAFRELKPLAELGHAPSQYMLGVMYTRGEGTSVNSTLGYGWIQLAADAGYAPAQRDLPNVKAGMLEESVEAASRLLAEFQPQALNERLMPRMLPEGDYQDMSGPALNTNMPLGFSGERVSLVIADVSIAPDGRVREVRIAQALPATPHEEWLLRFLLAMPFKPATKDGMPQPSHATLVVTFGGAEKEGYVPGRSNPIVTHMPQIKAKAEQGEADSAYVYGMFVADVANARRKAWSEALPWIVKAAQAGLKEAQYDVGLSLLTGRGCEADVGKATRWLRAAADQQDPSAQLTLARLMMDRGTKTDASNGLSWLRRAVEQKHPAAQKYYASLLAASPDESLRDPSKALELLREMNCCERPSRKELEELPVDPARFEILAASLANSGKFDEALQWQGDALRLAGLLKWNTADMEKRLASYRQRQPWYGEIVF